MVLLLQIFRSYGAWGFAVLVFYKYVAPTALAIVFGFVFYKDAAPTALDAGDVVIKTP